MVPCSVFYHPSPKNAALLPTLHITSQAVLKLNSQELIEHPFLPLKRLSLNTFPPSGPCPSNLTSYNMNHTQYQLSFPPLYCCTNPTILSCKSFSTTGYTKQCYARAQAYAHELIRSVGKCSLGLVSS